MNEKINLFNFFKKNKKNKKNKKKGIIYFYNTKKKMIKQITIESSDDLFKIDKIANQELLKNKEAKHFLIEFV